MAERLFSGLSGLSGLSAKPKKSKKKKKPSLKKAQQWFILAICNLFFCLGLAERPERQERPEKSLSAMNGDMDHGKNEIW
jgi:hypothetical protein